jgi:predicted deacylase
MRPFKAISYASVRAGRRLIVLGAVHGNETCGTRAIERVAAEIDAGTLQLTGGRLTLVPVANPLAYAHKRRAGDRNLNRKLTPTATPHDYEDHVANWLCPLLAQHEVLLDLHSFQSPGAPFVMLGPLDNDGPLEPFAQSAREEALAVRLGVGRAVDGWLGTYATGVARRRELAAAWPAAPLDLDPRYGIGTTEFMRSSGGCALTLECGQHADPEAPIVAYRAIVATLAHLGLINAPDPTPATRIETLTCARSSQLHPDDAFAQAWRSFDATDGQVSVPGTTAAGGRAVRFWVVLERRRRGRTGFIWPAERAPAHLRGLRGVASCRCVGGAVARRHRRRSSSNQRLISAPRRRSSASHCRRHQLQHTFAGTSCVRLDQLGRVQRDVLLLRLGVVAQHAALLDDRLDLRHRDRGGGRRARSRARRACGRRSPHRQADDDRGADHCVFPRHALAGNERLVTRDERMAEQRTGQHQQHQHEPVVGALGEPAVVVRQHRDQHRQREVGGGRCAAWPAGRGPGRLAGRGLICAMTALAE